MPSCSHLSILASPFGHHGCNDQQKTFVESVSYGSIC